LDKNSTDAGSLSEVITNTCHMVSKQPPHQMAGYKETDFAPTHKFPVVEKAAINKNTVASPYEIPTAQSRSVNRSYGPSGVESHKIAESMKVEQKIYETPCEDESPFGTVYVEPSVDEHKLYEEFQGKRFFIFYHNEIRSVVYDFNILLFCK